MLTGKNGLGHGKGSCCCALTSSFICCKSKLADSTACHASSIQLGAHLLPQHCDVWRPEAVSPSSTLTQQVQHQRLRQAISRTQVIDLNRDNLMCAGVRTMEHEQQSPHNSGWILSLLLEGSVGCATVRGPWPTARPGGDSCCSKQCSMPTAALLSVLIVCVR